MKIAVAADERVGVAEAVARGAEASAATSRSPTGRSPTASATTGPGQARRRRATSPKAHAEQAIVCCWTGTGASIAANKVAGVRAALCTDAQTADGGAEVERRQRAGDQPPRHLGGRARRDPRCLVRGGAEPRGRGPRQRRAPRRDRVAPSSHEVRRVCCRGGRRPITLAEQFAELDLVGDPPADRPYMVINFAATVDGRATIEGRARADRQRSRHGGADAAALARRRGDDRGRDDARRALRPRDPRSRPAREAGAVGLPHDPLAVIVSRTLDLPWDAGLFTEGPGRVLIFTTSKQDPPEVATSTRVVRQDGDGVDLAAAMAHLRGERGIRGLVCEGGPHIHAELVGAGLLDELFLTIAPKLSGGAGPGHPGRHPRGIPEAITDLELAWLLEAEGELFARYRLTADLATPTPRRHWYIPRPRGLEASPREEALRPESPPSCCSRPSAVPAAASARDATVNSFDGTPITTHFFPADGPARRRQGSDGARRTRAGACPVRPTPTAPATPCWRTSARRRSASSSTHGYNVVTWDPRGFGTSGGTVMVDDSDFEGRDAQALIDFVAQQPEAQMESRRRPAARYGRLELRRDHPARHRRHRLPRRRDRPQHLPPQPDLEPVQGTGGEGGLGPGADRRRARGLDPPRTDRLPATDRPHGPPHLQHDRRRPPQHGLRRKLRVVRGEGTREVRQQHPHPDAADAGPPGHPLHPAGGDRQLQPARRDQRRAAEDDVVLRRPRRLHHQPGPAGYVKDRTWPGSTAT